MFYKLSALVLALIIAASAAAGCASGSTGDDETSGNGEAPSDTMTDTSAEETTEDFSSFMPSADYDGYEFRIVNSAPTEWGLDAIDSEGTTGEIFNDTVFERNARVEDRLNIKITGIQVGDVGSAVRQSVLSNTNDYDLAYTELSSCATLATGDNLVDMAKLSKLNLDMPWWDRASIDSLSVAGRTFFAENDINMHYNEATWVLFFNKSLVTEYTLESPYDLVRGNKWTMDKMHEMMLAVARDADGNGEMNGPEDYFGFATHWGSYVGMLNGGGETLIVKNDDGEYVSNLTNERCMNVALKVGEIINDMNATAFPDRFKGTASPNNEWAKNTFYNGHCLFYGEVIGSFTRLREMDQDFGLIPFPKYETTQEYYTCQVLNSARAMSIPRSYSDLDRACDIIEAMAIDSHTSLLPNYLDVTITGKAMRDEDSREMLELIFQYRMYDLGDVYGWGSLSNTLQNAIKNPDAYMSTVEKTAKAVSKAAAKSVESLADAKGD